MISAFKGKQAKPVAIAAASIAVRCIVTFIEISSDRKVRGLYILIKGKQQDQNMSRKIPVLWSYWYWSELTYEDLSSKVFVYAWRPPQTHRCGTRNPDRSLEPRTGYCPRGPRNRRKAQACAIHHGAQNVADHGREGPGPPR